MGRLGHSTPGAAMRYQHAAADRDAEIARWLGVGVGAEWHRKATLGEHKMGRATSSARRGFGRIERRQSGRYRAAYTGPDGQLYRAPITFDAKG